MPYHYLLFDFDLPYGEKLPVVTAVTRDEKVWLKTLNSSNYEDDDYISLDGAYISLPNLIDSRQIIADALTQFKKWSFKNPKHLKLLGDTFTIPQAIQRLNHSRPLTRTQFM